MSQTPTTTSRAREGRSAREAVIAAASRLMRLHGYHATSLDDVLRESGVGKGNFYYYFRSKEELGYAILDELVTDFVERTLEPCFADPAADPLGQIHCFLDRIVATHRERNCVGGCPLGTLASELSDVHEGFRTRLAGIFSAWRERLTRAVEEAKARSRVREDCVPAAVAHLLVASLEGAILLAKVTKDVRALEACVVEMKRYLAGYEVAR